MAKSLFEAVKRQLSALMEEAAKEHEEAERSYDLQKEREQHSLSTANRPSVSSITSRGDPASIKNPTTLPGASSSQGDLLALHQSFEKIYSIETVDVQKIRPISPKTATAIRLDATRAPSERYPSRQPLLNFGPPWEASISSCFLDEPLKNLDLHRPLINQLQKASCHTIGDLYSFIASSAQTTSLAHQSLIDEAKALLATYPHEGLLSRSYSLDLGSFIRRSMMYLEPLEALLLLDQHQLSNLYLLSDYEKSKIKRREEEWRRHQADLALLKWVDHEPSMVWMGERWKAIFQAFVVPWLKRRSRVASRSEVYERLLSCCSQYKSLKNLLELMRAAWKIDPLTLNLIAVEEELLAVDEATALLSQEIIERCRLILKERGEGVVDELVRLLLKEPVFYEDEDPTSLIEGTLYRSNKFCCYRRSDGQLAIAAIPWMGLDA